MFQAVLVIPIAGKFEAKKRHLAGRRDDLMDTGMAMVADGQPLFENEEWIVTESALEHKQTGYAIERGDLAQRRGDRLWTWPMHMAEKSWCTMAPFTEAFSCAASLYGIKTDAGLAESFRIARCEIASWPVDPASRTQGRNATRNGVSPVPDLLQNKGGNTISVKAEWAERSVPVGPEIVSHHADSRWPGVRSHALRGSGSERTPRALRAAGNRLVQLLQAAWNVGG